MSENQLGGFRRKKHKTAAATHIKKKEKKENYLSCVLSSVKRGLLLGSYDQHFVIRL